MNNTYTQEILNTITDLICRKMKEYRIIDASVAIIDGDSTV